MQSDESTDRKRLTREFMEALIRLGLVVFLMVICLRVLAPFTNLLLLALILAVALYPLHQRLARLLRGRQGSAATLLVVAGLLLIGVPTGMLGNLFASYVHNAYTAYEDNTIIIQQPDPKVEDWPIVGTQVYSTWINAAKNFPKFLEENRPHVKNISRWIVSAAANMIGSSLRFFAAFILAGVMMAYGESGSKSMQRIFNRLAGTERGPRLHSLSAATVRSVANGVIGVALIQSLLMGIGFVMAGIPAAGVLALIVLLIAIIQLPTSIISLPIIAYIWWAGTSSTMSNIFYSIYLIVAGMVDNVLKPLLLGRGVDAPMPVVLLGALGGMVSGGLTGMFVGAVMLAVGYRVFMEWVDKGEEDVVAETTRGETADQAGAGGEAI